MKRKEEQIEAMKVERKEKPRTALDLWRVIGQRAVPQAEKGKMAPDSMLAVYKDRVTYTFIMGDEIASIHFDRRRGEIFFKGHNIGHLKLSDIQREALLRLKEVILGDPRAKTLFSDYCTTLGRYLADNNKGARKV